MFLKFLIKILPESIKKPVSDVIFRLHFVPSVKTCSRFRLLQRSRKRSLSVKKLSHSPAPCFFTMSIQESIAAIIR